VSSAKQQMGRLELATPQVFVSSDPGEYCSKIISSPAEINQLEALAQSLLSSHDCTLHPRFFSASIANKSWLPRVVAVRQSGNIVGLLYAKEWKIAGIPTGIIYVDASLGKMLVAEPIHRENVFHIGLRSLIDLPHVCGMRIMAATQGFEIPALQRLLPLLSVDACYTPVKHHSCLLLPSSYHQFLASLGYHTRQDFRRYRRRFEAANHKYFENLSLADFKKAAMPLVKRDTLKTGSHEIERAIRMLSAVDRPWLAGLRHSNGEWLSVVGGWYEADRVVLFTQLNNDRKYARFQLSTVLRGYFIESLIANNVREILFWGGVGGPLSRYATYIACVGVHLDNPRWTWRWLRRGVKLLQPFFPLPIARASDWIVPRAPQSMSELSRLLEQRQSKNAQFACGPAVTD
jgi:hypothetical protein